MLSEPREALPRKSTLKFNGKPGEMDLTTVYQGQESRPLFTRSIFELKGNLLKYAIAAPGVARPTDFTSKSGDGRTVVTMRRLSGALLVGAINVKAFTSVSN